MKMRKGGGPKVPLTMQTSLKYGSNGDRINQTLSISKRRYCIPVDKVLKQHQLDPRQQYRRRRHHLRDLGRRRPQPRGLQYTLIWEGPKNLDGCAKLTLQGFQKYLYQTVSNDE